VRKGYDEKQMEGIRGVCWAKKYLLTAVYET
jgi:hypothetical protein